MKEQTSIPTGKVERASRFVATGLKVGGNYIKHYTKKLIDPSISREELHADNAEDIYDTLSNLKGSALKVAQMLSLDRGMLPKAYTERFAMSQYSAPPLSGPLVVNTFLKTLGKMPSRPPTPSMKGRKKIGSSRPLPSPRRTRSSPSSAPSLQTP